MSRINLYTPLLSTYPAKWRKSCDERLRRDSQSREDWKREKLAQKRKRDGNA